MWYNRCIQELDWALQMQSEPTHDCYMEDEKEQHLEWLVMSYLWIYTSIAGALLGAACLAYIRETKIGLWGYKQFDRMLDWLRDRYGLTWFDQPEDAWKKVSPKIAKKIEELEKRLKIVESRWIDDGR